MKTAEQITLTAIAILVLFGCEDSTSSRSYEFDESIDHVVVNTDFGDIIVQGRAKETTDVTVELSCRSVVPDYDVSVDDGTLSISLEAGTGSSSCEGTIEIAAPFGVSADLRTGRGDVSAIEIDGALEAVSYDGSVYAEDLSGDLDLTVVSGDIVGTDLESASTTASAGNGDVEIGFRFTPTVVDVDVISGNTRLSVPSSAYYIDAATDSGEVEVKGVSNVPNSDKELVVTADTGRIAISGR